MIENKGSGWIDKGSAKGKKWTSSVYIHEKQAELDKEKFKRRMKRHKAKKVYTKKASGDPDWWKYKPLFKSGTYDTIITSGPGEPLYFACVPKKTEQEVLFDMQDQHLEEIRKN